MRVYLCSIVRSIALLVSALLLYSTSALAHDIITTNLTFTRDISRILARHCLSCHGVGSSIPLTNYAEVRPWAVSIKEQVLSRAMPPWGAVKGFGDLSPDYSLSQEDILILAAWVIGGAPQGDPGLLPKLVAPAVQPSLPTLKDAVTVDTHLVLKSAVRVVGVRPLSSAPVESSRLTAHLPDGGIEPLVWLYQFQPDFKRIFLFREPIEMPAGTVVEASSPVRFALESR